MNDKEPYRELVSLTKRKGDWQTSIPYVGSLLESQQPKIVAKTLWLLGEMGLQHPEEIAPYAEKIASFLEAQDDLLRERALNALGRIGRARFDTVKPYFERMLVLSTDSNPRVRLSFIWASENIAATTPDTYEPHLPLFAELLYDKDDKVRMEAPELFRVLGKRRPQLVLPYLDLLQWMAENDAHPVVRIHSASAIRITQAKKAPNKPTTTILYIHGNGGSADESGHYKPLFPDCEVTGLDYQTSNPWDTGKEIHAAVAKLKSESKNVILIANSIGAFFSIHAGIDEMIQQAYFISPIVDMEKLITNMMQQANVSEQELETMGTIHTSFGEDLSWDYLCYVRNHPIHWHVPTQILYGSNDHLTSIATISDFASKHQATLTVMVGGEHWFHTEEQMRFLDNWIKTGLSLYPLRHQKGVKTACPCQ